MGDCLITDIGERPLKVYNQQISGNFANKYTIKGSVVLKSAIHFSLFHGFLGIVAGGFCLR